MKRLALKTGEQTNTIVEDLEGALYRVAAVTARESQRRPSAPFTTSTLQQEASRKLGYPLRRTMQIAQELYEGVDLGAEGTQGLITYMRTDSTNIAASAQQAAREVIEAKYGKRFSSRPSLRFTPGNRKALRRPTRQFGRPDRIAILPASRPFSRHSS